jgi:hypothetical protein
MPMVYLRLALSADDLLRHYRGQAREVLARTHDGRTIRFPSSALREVVTDEGVYGDFALHFDEDHKLLGLRPVGRPPA